MTAEANGVIYGELGETVLLVSGYHRDQLECSDCRCQPGPLCHGKGGMLPAALAEVHPRYHTPKSDSADWGTVCDFTFGRPALVWLVNAGARHRCGLCLRCLILSGAAQNEPELERPYQYPDSFTGYLALTSQWPSARSISRSSSALIWPGVGDGCILDHSALLFGLSRFSNRADASDNTLRNGALVQTRALAK